MKKRITILALEKGYDGVCREIIALANNLVDLFDVSILFLKDNNDSININSKINVIVSEPTFLESRKFYTDLFRKSSVVIATDQYFNKIVTKYADCKTILWAHQEDTSSNMKILKRYDLIVVPNKFLKTQYQEYNDNVLIINDAIELTGQKITSGNNLIFVGKLTKDKRLDMLINIFDKVSKSFKTNLIIIGEGEERKNLENLVKSKRMKNIYFRGLLTKEEVESEFLNSALYVTCGKCDNNNLAMLEAMSYGVPILAFDEIVEATSFIVDDINGYLIRGRNKDEMYERIMELLTNEEKRKNFSLCAKEKSQEFDIYSLKIEWLKIL